MNPGSASVISEYDVIPGATTLVIVSNFAGSKLDAPKAEFSRELSFWVSGIEISPSGEVVTLSLNVEKPM